MADIIETIKQGADDLLSGIDQKGQIRSTIDGIRSQWSEMDRRRKVSSLEKQIKAQRSEMRQLTEALGLQTLSLYETGAITNPELSRLCERIQEVRDEVETQKAQIEQMKAEAQALAQAQAEARAQQRAAQAGVKCSQCGTTIPANAEFCPHCGAQQIKAAQPVQPAQAQRVQPAAAPVVQRATVTRLRCPQCKAIMPSDAEFCSNCGVKFKRPAAAPAAGASYSAGGAPSTGGAASVGGTRFCPSCGAEVKPNARFCPICGQTIA